MNASAAVIRATAGRRIEAARRQGLEETTIVAGDLVNELGIRNGTPSVCQVLNSKKLAQEYHVVLERREGPPSGQSTTMKYTYRLSSENGFGVAMPLGSTVPRPVTLKDMRGAWREMYDAEGGVEAVIADMVAARGDKKESRD